MSFVAVGFLTFANAADEFGAMFQEGKVSGQIRSFWIDRAYEGSAGKRDHRDGWALGGNLKYETATYKGFSFGTAFYTTNALDISSNRQDYVNNDMTLLGPNNEDYSLFGEAYVGYKYANTSLKGGRQKLDTPMAGSDDARMIPNLFEAYLLVNTDLQNTTFVAGHIRKFAQGTFGRVYNHTSASPDASKVLSATSGYSYDDSLNHTGAFVNMGNYALGVATDGVSLVSVTYAVSKNVKVQLWDYYAYDILNAVYGEVNVGWNCLLTDKIKPSFSAQMIKENGVGQRFADDVNSFYAAGKFDLKVGDASVYVAYSEQSKNDTATAPSGLKALNKATITPWGGMPAYTQGMVTRHQFIAGTKATKVAASYDFKNLGANVLVSAYYTSFDMDKNSGYGLARVATEPGFDVAYKPEGVKNLELKLRGNFPRDYAESSTGTTGWDEYRFIANYNF